MSVVFHYNYVAIKFNYVAASNTWLHGHAATVYIYALYQIVFEVSIIVH